MEISIGALQDHRMQLTPHMRQSMEILHMSSLDLHELVKQQANENPFIELKHRNPASRNISGSNPDWRLNVDPSATPTLESVLLEQIACMNLDSRLKSLCKWIIGNLDAKGYLPYTRDEISAIQGSTLEQVRQAVQIIQCLEPYGVGASTLAECLLLQLQQMKGIDPLAADLIQQDLPDIAAGRIHQLAVKYDTEPSRIQAAIKQIKVLNPKPGAMYSREQPQYVIPDLTLKLMEGTYTVFLENAAIPGITLSDSYLRLMEEKASQDVYRYLKQQWQAAKGLMDSIERRKATLLQTASLMFELQADFCAKGTAHIGPMTMKQVAEALQVHESTVSRTVSRKYVQTPWGIFELKYFFSSSMKQIDGTSVSSFYMKEKLREAIAGEDRNRPYSDQQLSELLISKGFVISRRTVAKYREQMNLPPALKRRSNV
ncbi:RNA polymerase factor sigma-54 [Paenibacillus chondroitinus]|uniref:RNA polymerase factor sigma-54 n=1 Tax=Paenibacillus chondroitinus TaxID=59842 RepID=A0ABU6DJM1_9BACL|nr:MULTISPECIES: RNA polymerase factor sigma-54 [Paenibacillus]MCY9657773.1 RNA polymerase factor sigma-54 [Paenibacillus anseongense]MEB4797540.1 RNA polymerase factor sigma-54 [Paenibacillus chondroitinus]